MTAKGKITLPQKRTVIFTVTILYTILILYFIFFAFGRIGASASTTGVTFIFFPIEFYHLPKISDFLHPTLMDFVDLGNVAAFIPFGILIPLLFRVKFIRFFSLFFLSILVIETIQALTLLGSFDINDAIQNSLGASIGFGAYKLGYRTKNFWLNMAITGITCIVILIGVLAICGILEKTFTKAEGPFIALNELKNSSGHTTAGTKPYSFKVSGQNVEPGYNIFGAIGKGSETYTYTSKKEIIFSFYYGIPDLMDSDGSIRVLVDGREVLSGSGTEQLNYPELFPQMFEIPLERASKITIIVKGNEKLWDVGFREMKYFWK